MKRDNPTYRSVEARYDEYVEIVASKPVVTQQPRALPPQRPYTPQNEREDMGKTVFAGIGFGIGALLLLLAVWAFVVAGKWSGLDRGGAAVGYTLVGLFLVLSGAGGIIATWNHNFRVLTGRGGHSH
jgi:hypothetical protein